MRSFIIVIVTFHSLTALIVSLVKYIRYKVQNRNRANTSAVNAEAPPILILECNNENEIGLIGMICFGCAVMCVFSFFAADWMARKDIATFLFLSEEQIYTLYYWNAKLVGVLGSLLIGTALIQLRIRKRVVFYKNMIILENGLFGKKVLVVDSDLAWKEGVNKKAVSKGHEAARIYNRKAGFLSTIIVRNQ